MTKKLCSFVKSSMFAGIGFMDLIEMSLGKDNVTPVDIQCKLSLIGNIYRRCYCCREQQAPLDRLEQKIQKMI